ncbi:MAG: late competence development ComFB family protein [Treponema sp.]|uniref:late competence development ComFB family protein n=1 Tax=Treponema sp. TaxID=166 RepID=UPI001B4EABAB|nr:late competence development ComFB family protein [Treponema sp.]MBP5588305.1 late competence development ComFB family protein [Treponema sp.]MBR0154946.1 late competence development ComFB family protein [Treponema sp.]MCR5385987.1 late competence development ComFB family protein [Treponema sp.]
MKIHNLMEELVEKRVNKLYDDLKEAKTSWLTCDCENCRSDVMAFVLNRIPPKYIISARGITHTAADGNLTQIKADIDTLAIEAIRIVSISKRPTHNIKSAPESFFISGTVPYFFFPTFTGTVMDGTTFEPLSNATITLLQDGKPAKMVDQSWANPTKTYVSTKGTYSFCVQPEQAQKEKEDAHFSFTVKVEAEGYEPVSYAFSIPVISEILHQNRGLSLYSLKIQDLFLFPEGLENPME